MFYPRTIFGIARRLIPIFGVWFEPVWQKASKRPPKAGHSQLQPIYFLWSEEGLSQKGGSTERWLCWSLQLSIFLFPGISFGIKCPWRIIHNHNPRLWRVWGQSYRRFCCHTLRGPVLGLEVWHRFLLNNYLVPSQQIQGCQKHSFGTQCSLRHYYCSSDSFDC